MNKKIITGIALCGMVAGLAHAADIRFRQTGNWTNTAPLNTGPGWQNVGAVPTTADLGIINWGNNTVTLSTPETIGEIRVGQDDLGNLHITGTGSLTTDKTNGKSGRLTLGQGNSPVGTGILTVDSGGILTVTDILFNGNKANGTANISGTVNVASHLWTGWNSGVTGTYNVNDGGVLNVDGQLGLNWEGTRGTGIINIFDGGTVDLDRWSFADSIGDGSYIAVNDGGTLKVGGNRVADVEAWALVGKLTSDLGTVEAVHTVDGDFTTITAVIPEPATLGLFAAFGGAVLFIRRRFKM